MRKKILASCIGNCVHVAGPINFLRVADKLDYETIFLGPAKSPEEIIKAIKKENPDIVALSYRLTPQIGKEVLSDFEKIVLKSNLSNKEYILGGLPSLIEIEKQNKFFNAYFQGGEYEEVIAFLKGENMRNSEFKPPQDVIERIAFKKPFPLLRHHFGLPSMKDTLEGIAKISQNGVLDVISLGTDQDAQANFFNPERMKKEAGAGGVPVRTEEDFKKLYEASRQGNFPLMRTYAGTEHLIKYAEVIQKTINNAWSAIPIFWFNQMDGRGPMSLKYSIKEHLDAIKWHAEQNIPVEVLESHHWSMRDAPDEVAVAAGFLGAAICKELGVQNFISQYMFNTPAHTTQRDDLAKMLAQKELINTLVDSNFNVYTQTRTGLVSYPVDLFKAKGQLASSTMLQMQLNPDLIHIVSYSEASHAATADDVIESTNIVKRVIENSLEGMPDMKHDPYIIRKKDELKNKASDLLSPYVNSSKDYINVEKLYSLISSGTFHAPQLKKYLKEEHSQIKDKYKQEDFAL